MMIVPPQVVHGDSRLREVSRTLHLPILFATAVLAAACDGGAPVAPRAQDSTQEAPALLPLESSSSALAQRRYAVIRTVYEIDSQGRRKAMKSRKTTDQSSVIKRKRGENPNGAEARTIEPMWEGFMRGRLLRPAGPAVQVGKWTHSRHLDGDGRVLVVSEGTGRAPATSTSFYRDGRLEARLTEQWAPHGGAWEVRRREMEFVANGIVDVAEFHPAEALSLHLSPLAHPANSLGTISRAAGQFALSGADACYISDDEEGLCEPEKREWAEKSEAAVWNMFITLLECGGVWLGFLPSGGATVLGSALCLNLTLQTASLLEHERSAMRRYYDCIARARAAKTGMNVLYAPNTMAARTATTGGPGVSLSTTSGEGGSCEAPSEPFDPTDPESGGAGDGFEYEEADGSCFWFITYNKETGVIHTAVLLFCQ